ncbi:MAG: TIR domain-containing protein [Calditrichaeota bacterium]|nr:MAG: TIR domain-containing protein [Calditrichota bacterium]
MKIPKVFISYSHDSQEHKMWVMDLATRLRNFSVDAILDQWELKLGDDLPHFMETNLESSDYVLMICTDNYVKKANAGKGGVGYEKMIVTSDLMSRIDSNKIIPIIRQDGAHKVPTFLKTKLFIDFSLNNDYESNFDELARTIHKKPLFKKPEIGNNPFVPVEELRPEKTNDLLFIIMKEIVSRYENGATSFLYSSSQKSFDISRILFDINMTKAGSLGYIKRFSRMNDFGEYQDLVGLTHKGKVFAIEQNLIKK